MSDKIKLIEVSRSTLEEGLEILGWSVIDIERRGTSSNFFLVLREDRDAD